MVPLSPTYSWQPLGEALAKRTGLPSASGSRSHSITDSDSTHGKEVYTQYSVTGKLNNPDYYSSLSKVAKKLSRLFSTPSSFAQELVNEAEVCQ